MSSGHVKLAARIARSIETDIMELGWPVGESVGSESQLIERYGVSRAVMREAVRIVESHGAACMRLGPGGGLTVTAPSPEAVIETVGLLLDHAEVTPRDLFEARNAVELTCVTLAAERIDEDGVGMLRAVLDDERELGPGTHSPGLHLAIAEATGNPVLRVLVEILCRLTADHQSSRTRRAEDPDEIHSAHASIVAAIVAGDAPLAQHRLRRHLADMINERRRPERRALGLSPAAQVQTPF